MVNRSYFVMGAIWTLSGSCLAVENETTATTAIPHERVELRGGFWGRRLTTHHEVTVPHALDRLEQAGHVTNFDKAAGKFEGPLRGHHAFDSDLHKALEGAIYSLQHREDEELRRLVDGILARVLAAQQKDGYLISYFTVKETDQRWQDLRLRHELYNAGHFFEMAVAHQRWTGRTEVLDAARRFADHIDGIFGPGKRYDTAGHQEIELALIKLHRATGEQRYLDLARFFLDERGHVHGAERRLLDPASVLEPKRPPGELDADQRRAHWHARLRWRNGRMQDHKPLTSQKEAVGHAVRAGYVYSAMADLARLASAADYETAVHGLWDDVVSRKMYVTGGIGTAQYGDEGFGDPYLLPNESAYSESCAAIAHVLWQHRMHLLTGQAKYIDVMELALYNAALAGIAVSGDSFFYHNPLASKRGARRRSWIGLACCPTNLTRIFPQVGGLAYSRSPGRLYVNLYASGEVELETASGVAIGVSQQTEYPWDGSVRLEVSPARPVDFTIALRHPGWARGLPVPSDLYRFGYPASAPLTIHVNGESVDASTSDDGYVHIARRWQKSDVIELEFPMPIRRVYAHSNVAAGRGKVALMRGPIVYCVEATDHAGADVLRMALPRAAELRPRHAPGLLGGVTTLTGRGVTAGGETVPLTAIPYYAWANREPGAMTVWLDEPSEGR